MNADLFRAICRHHGLPEPELGIILGIILSLFWQTMIYVLEIPGWLPAPLNQLLGHWAKAHRLKVKDREMIGKAWLAHGYPKATGLRTVHLYLIGGKNNRARDDDSSWKSTLDALVQCGALVDDSPAYARTGLVRHAKAEQPATFITLEDA